MDDLIIEATSVTPCINFKSDGNLLIEGKALPEDPEKFFKTVFAWARDFHTPHTKLSVRMIYVNTSSSKQIFELLKILAANHQSDEIEVLWFYEEGDYDILESGKYFESLLKIPFEYIEYEEVD